MRVAEKRWRTERRVVRHARDLAVATGGTSVDVALAVHISTGSAGDGVIVFEADSESLVLVVE